MNIQSTILAIGIGLALLPIITAVPNGAGVTFISSSGPTGENASSSNISAFAGNLTEIVISTSGGGSSQTWHGFYGNVTGAMSLEDSSSNALYNWSSTTPLGEVFSTINDSIVWTNIQCFNFTAKGNFSDDSAQAGATSYYGLNASQANTQYGINHSDVDSINETFDEFDHQEFFVNSQQFSANECPSVKMLNSSGAGVFEEILLYAPENKNMIFTAIIKQDTEGFDGNKHDFQMIVPEDGHGADTNTTTYYFYLELG